LIPRIITTQQTIIIILYIVFYLRTNVPYESVYPSSRSTPSANALVLGTRPHYTPTLVGHPASCILVKTVN